MEALRIKCPSCGIILEVKNSKHEAVKRITCPNCRKQLAVTFADAPQPKPAALPQPIAALYIGAERYQLAEGQNAIPQIPGGLAELTVTRLADGSCKHILKALTATQPIKVNGQALQPDDEIILQRGDRVEIGRTVISFDLPNATPTPPPVSLQQSKAQQPNRPLMRWLPLALVFVVAALAVWHFLPGQQPSGMVVNLPDSLPVQKDTVAPPKVVSRQETKQPAEAKPKDKQPKSSKRSATDDYNLEIEASSGNTQAQYQLGMRWVTSGDCSKVIKGVRYLEAAARNGNNDARYALGIVYHKGSSACGISRNPALSLQYMQQAAANGHAKAQRFLDNNEP